MKYVVYALLIKTTKYLANSNGKNWYENWNSVSLPIKKTQRAQVISLARSRHYCRLYRAQPQTYVDICCQFYFRDRDQVPHMARPGPITGESHCNSFWSKDDDHDELR